MKNKLKISLKIFIIILIFVGIIALIPSVVTAWSQSTLKSGVTINYRYSGADYTLANGPEGLYCVYHGAKVGNSKSKYTLKYIIKIEGKNATLYNSSGTQVGSTVKSKKNAKMAYILGGGSWTKKYGTTSTYTARQLAIYSYWNTFVGQWSTLSGYSHSQNKSVSQTTTSKTILSKAETYSESTSSGASATAVTTSLSLKSSEITNNRVGAFKVKYTGTPTLTVYDSDGNEVTNYKIYSSKTSTTALSTIPNNSSFYIWTSDGDVGKIKVSVKSSSVLTATIYIISHSNKQDLIAVDTDKTSTSAEVEIPVTITKVGDLKVIKTDKTTGKKITGMKFKVQTSKGWLQQTSSGWKYNATFANATEFEITKKAGYTLADLNVSIKYKVWETETASEYYLLTDQETYSSDYDAVNLTGDTWITLTKNDTVSVTYSNVPVGDLTVIKYDKITEEKLTGMEFKIKTSDGNWLQQTDDGWNYEATFENATTFTITSEDGYTVENLRADLTYQVWETKVPNDDYVLSEQENYDSELDAANLTGDSWIEVTGGETVAAVYYNEATYISISGKVWVDEIDDKTDEYDNLYDDESLDESLVEGVIVELRKKDDDSLIATTKTDTKGYYIFSRDDEYVHKNQVDEYYIKFDYSVTDEDGNSSINTYKEGVYEETIDGTNYIPVAFNSEDADLIVDDGSRALMAEVAEKDEDLSGEATTYTGTDSDEEQIYGLSGNLFDKLYNADSYTLENINLGLLSIYEPTYALDQDILYVKIVEGDSSYLYEYSERKSFIVNDEVTITTPTVSYQDSQNVAIYTKEIYTSSVASAALGNKLEVYVVYQITIQNMTAYSVDNRYMEQQLCITSLTDTFDTSRYILNTEASNIMTDTVENEVYSDFGKWTDEDGVATYTEGEIDLDPYAYVDGEDETGNNDTANVYIQFQLTTDAICEILGSSSGSTTDFPVYATTSGYHKYTRYDWDWTLDGDATYETSSNMYKINYSESGGSNSIVDLLEHETTSQEKTAMAPYMWFKLAEDDREISGIVFEDSDKDSSDNEVIGSGAYEDGEGLVENVTVTLVDSSGNDIYENYVYIDEELYFYINEETDEDGDTIYDVYYKFSDGAVSNNNKYGKVKYSYRDTDGNYYLYSDSEGKCISVSEADMPSEMLESRVITATTNSDGEYTLDKIAIGSYKLKFTYYDEDATVQTTIYNSDGTTKTISINDYKSTIVTSTAAMEALGYDTETSYGDEWYKYLEDDNYSVATDDLSERSNYNEEYYNYQYNGGTLTTVQMDAYTPEFCITIENTEENFMEASSTTEYYVLAEGTDERAVIYWIDDEGNIYESATANCTEVTTEVYITGVNQFTGFNFGIITQPVQSLEIEKLITNVTLTNTPLTIFNGNPETDDLTGVSDLDSTTNGGSTYTRVELDEDYIYGSELTVTYEITITNTSDVNYWEDTSSNYYGWYYMFGEVTDDAQIVYIQVDTLYDYLDADLTLTGSIYEYVYENSSTGDLNKTGSTDLTYEINENITTATSSRKGEFDVTTYSMEDLTPIARYNEENETGIAVEDVITLSATKTLSTADEDMAYSNIGEIIQATNTDSDGNTTDGLYLVKTPELPEKAEAYITISPPTGGDMTTVLIYIIAGLGMLIILSIGIVIIKKRVL